MVHQIRLREPWNSEKMPGGVRYTRHFNAPSGLSQESQVDLVVKSVSRRLSVVFNGQSLGSLGGPQARTSFDIRSLLQLHNQIWIEVRGRYGWDWIRGRFAAVRSVFGVERGMRVSRGGMSFPCFLGFVLRDCSNASHSAESVTNKVNLALDA